MPDEIIKKFLQDISTAQSKIKEIYLFGSRARTDWKPDSDYDILVILESRDREIINRLYDSVIDTLLTTGKLISLKIFDLSEYCRLKSLSTPFIGNIIKEGIRIGFND